MLSLYALLIWRSLRILTIAKNLYGALLAAGVGAMLMTQVFVNVGGNVGIMPITGIPLPLMSYGGSSVIVTLIALGILQSVYVQAREAAASKRRRSREAPLARFAQRANANDIPKEIYAKASTGLGRPRRDPGRDPRKQEGRPARQRSAASR